jgi:hypothetical protein
MSGLADDADRRAGSGYPAPAVHFKRPFGDMSAFDIDVAANLGLPHAKGDTIDALLDRLFGKCGRRCRRSSSMWKSISPRVRAMATDPMVSRLLV